MINGISHQHVLSYNSGFTALYNFKVKYRGCRISTAALNFMLNNKI